MTDHKRKPGRPRGSSKYTAQDSRWLDEVADLLTRAPKLKKTPAIASVVQKHVPKPTQWAAAEQRLLRRWNKSEKQHMAEADERRRECYSQNHITASRALAAIGRGLSVGTVTAFPEPLSAPMLEVLSISRNLWALSEQITSPGSELLRHVQGEAMGVAAKLGRIGSVLEQFQVSSLIESISRSEAVLGVVQSQRLQEQINPLRRYRGS